MNHKTKSGSSLAMWIVLAIILFFLWILTGPQPRWKRSPHLADQRQAIQNARQIGLALFEFETEYGRFPDATTAAWVRQKTGTKWDLGNSSANDYFRQLIAAEILNSEKIFYAETAFTKKPQLDKELSDKPLGPGSVGFGYLLNGSSAFNTKGNPSRPVVCAPLALDDKRVSGQTFDGSIYDYKAVILRMDNSVSSVPILKKTKQAMLGGGKSLLDTGLDTVWGESATPVIIPPLPKR